MASAGRRFVARPLWSDAGTEPDAIAAHLASLADTADALRFTPRAVPSGLDTRVLHRAAILRARGQLTSAHGEQDRILAQEVRAIDDLVRSANLLVERLREWYALHAPEAVRATEPKQLADLVAHQADRAAVLAALEGVDAISLGSDLPAADVTALRSFAAALHGIHGTWDLLERRVSDLMQEVAPNLASVVGPVLGARLIAQAGSLQRLAGFPSGTIQTLGAETALFRHIKEGTKPPKHGILFQHPKVHQAKPWQRGPIARALALHAGLAAKGDSYTQRDMKAELAERLDKDLAHIAATRNNPPARPARGFGRDDRGPRGPPGKSGFKSGGKPGFKSGGQSGGKPYGKPGGPRSGGKPYGKPSDRRGPPRDDRAPRKRGPGAFRNQGDGPAKPPGGRK